MADVRLIYSEQELFVLVAAALGVDARARDRVSRALGAFRTGIEVAGVPQDFSDREGSLPGGRRYRGLGFVGHSRIPGGATRRRLAGRERRTGVGAQRGCGDALGLQ